MRCYSAHHYITYCVLEEPGEKVLSLPSNDNRTNLFMAYKHCELCNRQGFKNLLWVANSHKIIFGT